MAGRAVAHVHIGASGVVFGYAAYLVARGVYSRSLGQIALGLVVLAIWGTTLLQGLVPEDGISWQGHLFGALGGVLAARVLHRRAGPRRHRARPAACRAVLMFPLGAAATLAELETDPHPLLARLRAAEPVSWVPALDGWLVTRRDLALQVMRDPDTFTVDDERFSTGRVVGPSMLSLDGEAHAPPPRAVRAPVPARRRARAVPRAGDARRSTGCSTRSRRPARPSCGASWPARSPRPP